MNSEYEEFRKCVRIWHDRVSIPWLQGMLRFREQAVQNVAQIPTESDPANEALPVQSSSGGSFFRSVINLSRCSGVILVSEEHK